MERVTHWFVAVMAAILPLVAHAYTPTLMQNGTSVHWNHARLPLAGNPSNSTGIDPSSFYNAVVNGLQRWKSASGGSVGFDYWQGTDPKIYEPNSEYNGLSSIYFASNARGNTGLAPNVLGLTQVWYNTDNGEIVEADIVLNDLNYHFTTNPADTSGYGSTNISAGRNVYIENVITHELGHAFGLSHSGGLQSTMLFMESPEQAYLGCDEQVAIHAMYPTGDSGSRGTITGVVRSDATNGNIFGAHVLAISRKRGTVLASAVTDKSGHYRIAGLEAGTYFLMAEPFNAGSSALPAYYSGMNSNNVCNGQRFGRTLLTDSSGTIPQPISVRGGGSAQAPDLVAHCNNGGAAVSSTSAASRPSSAPTIYTGGSGFGVSDRFTSSNTLYYRIQNVSGTVEAHAMSYSLYSPLHPLIKLLDSNGNVVKNGSDNVYTSNTSGYVNFDSAVSVSGLPAGDYFIEVSAQNSMDASSFPAGPISVDTVPFIVVTGSVNEGAPALASSLPENARCRMTENFAAYQSPPGNPERHSLDGNSDSHTGFCGTVSADHGGSGGPGAGPGTIAGWFLPWVFMLAFLRLLRAQAANRLREVVDAANVYA